MGRKILLFALGAAAVAYVVSSRRRSRPADASGNGNPHVSSDAARRAVGEARQRIEADAESA